MKSYNEWSSSDKETADSIVDKGSSMAYGAAILGGGAVIALLSIGIALVWQGVPDQVWRNIILIILLIVAVVIALMWLWALFRGIGGRC